MITREAKEILLLYRPGADDLSEPRMREALELVDGDSELKQWFKNHRHFQQTFRDQLRGLPVPSSLQTQIIARQTIVPMPSWWQRPPVWAVAAAFVLLLGLAIWWSGPRTPDRFADFRSRMVRTALREYRMDILTNDMAAVRKFMARNNAPADYVVPKGLERLALTGGGLLRWRNHPVSMVCFDRGDQEMLFLFVLDQASVPDAPEASPQVATVNKLMTASWRQGDKVYVLAGREEDEFTKKYL